MDLPEDAALLRIFVGEADRHGGRPLYEAIVLEARSRGLAGATVLRGVLGGFTTYSTFGLETFRLVSDADFGRAAAYFGATNAGCLVAVWFAYRLVERA